MSQKRNYLLIGNVTKDLQADGTYTVGGTVTYASVVVKKLGWEPTIMTAAADDFVRPPYLADVDWRILPSPHTLTFRNIYDGQGNRRQIVGPIGKKIQPEEIPPDCREMALVHLCPLAQELPASTTKVFQNSALFSTPQGWLRHWNDQGEVSLGQWQGHREILPDLTCAVVSIEDVNDNWSIIEQWAAQTPLLVVTQGDQGCLVITDDRRFTVPSRPSKPVDPTGAGDVFAAAFFIRFVETGDLWHSARFANVAASMAIERPGAEGAPRRSEIEAYLAQHEV